MSNERCSGCGHPTAAWHGTGCGIVICRQTDGSDCLIRQLTQANAALAAKDNKLRELDKYNARLRTERDQWKASYEQENQTRADMVKQAKEVAFLEGKLAAREATAGEGGEGK